MRNWQYDTSMDRLTCHIRDYCGHRCSCSISNIMVILSRSENCDIIDATHPPPGILVLRRILQIRSLGTDCGDISCISGTRGNLQRTSANKVLYGRHPQSPERTRVENKAHLSSVVSTENDDYAAAPIKRFSRNTDEHIKSWGGKLATHTPLLYNPRVQIADMV